jgi:hypothetical protein
LGDRRIEMSTNGIVLKSPAPFQDDLRKYNVLYIILAAIGAIAGFIINGAPAALALAVCGLLPAYVIKAIIATKLTYALQKLSFVLPYTITGEALAGIVAIPLTQLGMTVTMYSGEPVVRIKNMTYLLHIYADGTFGLLFDQAAASRVLTGRRYISQYKNAIVAMGLIAFTVQQEMQKNLTAGNTIKGE